jgi:hypothetical protein
MIVVDGDAARALSAAGGIRHDPTQRAAHPHPTPCFFIFLKNT